MLGALFLLIASYFTNNSPESEGGRLYEMILDKIDSWDFHYSNPILEIYLFEISRNRASFPTSYGEIIRNASIEELRHIYALLP
jgi:hypothetical protein